MSLQRQLFVTVFILFIALFFGTFLLSVHFTRQYISRQLESNVQDTATSLGLSLTTVVDRNDRTTLLSMIQAVFDRGYYQMIKVENIDGKTLVERYQPVQVEGVPQWFVSFIPLKSPQAKAIIMSGWKQLGFIIVKAHPGYAYKELWQTMWGLFWWFLIVTLIIAILAYMLLKQILKPLIAIKQQAESICDGEFITLTEIPTKPEFKAVVQAMNKMSIKLKEIFSRQLKDIKLLKQELYQDSITNLHNRLYFNKAIRPLIAMENISQQKVIILISLKGMEVLRRHEGFETVKPLLLKVAELLRVQTKSFEDAIVASLSNETFVIVLTDIPKESLDVLLENIISSGKAIISPYLKKPYSMQFNAGVYAFRKNLPKTELMAAADTALRQAQIESSCGWYFTDDSQVTGEVIYTASQWHRLLKDAIVHKKFLLFFQPVEDCHRVKLHSEVFLRIKQDDNDVIDAKAFFPFADHFELTPELDQLVIEQALQTLKNRSDSQSKVAINLAKASILNTDFILWLDDFLQNQPNQAKQCIFEIPAFMLSHFRERIEALQTLLKKHQCAMSVDNFGRGFSDFNYLQDFSLAYVKIAGMFTRNLTEDDEHRHFIQSLVRVCHTLDIAVIACHVETEAEYKSLCGLDVDGMQGSFISMPKLDFL